VQAGSDQEFVDAVSRLLALPEARAQLGERARRLAISFDWREILPRYERFVLGN